MIAVLNAVLAKHLQIIVLYVRLHLLKLELLNPLVKVNQVITMIRLMVLAVNVMIPVNYAPKVAFMAALNAMMNFI